MVEQEPLTEHPSPRGAGRGVFGLLLILLATVLLRFPTLWQSPGGQDEDYYAVPGSTILKTGVPRIPYLPARDRQSVFYKADETLFALPPLYFYWQAAVLAIVGHGYGPARLSSLIVGLLAIVVVKKIGQHLFDDPFTPVVGAGLFALSRAFYFPATCARPDMLCALLLLLAVLALLSVEKRRRVRWAGLCIGLAGLTHPFALAGAGLATGMILIEARPLRQRLVDIVQFGGVAMFVMLAWLPLIVRDVDAFRVQFGNNVLSTSQGQWIDRLTDPLPALTNQCALIALHYGLLQMTLLFGPLLLTIPWVLRSSGRGLRSSWALALGSTLLLVLLQGPHPAKGYWCFPIAFQALLLARLLLGGAEQSRRRWILVGIAALLFMPGAGLKACLTHVQHWNDPNYSHRRFVQGLLAATTTDRRVLADVGYVLDFYLAGRDIELALDVPRYYQSQFGEADVLIVSRTGLRQDLTVRFGGRKSADLGILEELLAHYARIDRREGR